MVPVTRTRERLCLVLFGSILALLLAEGVLRLLPARHPRGALRQLHELRTDRAWLYGLRPGARATLEVTGDLVYEINQDGFRGPHYAMDKPPGVFRVVVLGDSLAFGYGVSESDTFVRQMETLLAARGPAQVLNFGVGGYNPYNEAALFADLGVKYRPDLVLVQFCVNDLNDPTLHFDAHTRLQLGTIPAEAYPDPSVRPAGASLVTRLLRPCRSLELCARFDDAWLAAHRPPSDSAAFRASTFPTDLSDRRVRRWIADRYGEIAREAARIDARFAVAVFPFRAQVARGAPAQLQAQLAALGKAKRWKVIDLLPAFRSAAANGAGPLFLDLWHPTREGHRVAAEAILAKLDRRRLLPTARGS